MPKANIKFYDDGKIITRTEGHVAVHDGKGLLGVYDGPDEWAHIVTLINMNSPVFISVHWIDEVNNDEILKHLTG